MKSSKSTKVKPAKEEECGIWLDTKELKEKKQQNRPRPMSRYSVSVAVSFTQTRLNMPVTRQSSISSFCIPKPTDPNRSAAAHTGTTHTGSKRKHDVTVDSSSRIPEVHLQNWDRDWEGSTDRGAKEQRFFHLICGEEDEPPEKRRHVAHHTDQHVLETQECWNTEEHPNLHGMSQEASPSPKDEDKHDPRDQKLTVLTSRPINEHHRGSSAWRKSKASPMKRMGKENSCPASPIENTPSSPFRRRLLSSRKERHTLSPVKHASAETAGETLVSLFTQDSEGLCVIAHRDRPPSPEGSDPASVTEEEEEEEEVLFTQDSEGNMVIKH